MKRSLIKRQRNFWQKKVDRRKHNLKAFRKQNAAPKKIRRAEKLLAKARARRDYFQKLLDKRPPMRLRAWHIAGTLLGVMEHGGNNRGDKVSEIIKANGGTGPEPWCGDFVAFCYRMAGSTTVERMWAAVSWLYSRLTSVPLAYAKRGHIAIFTFDHTGLFGWWSDSSGRRVPYRQATHCVTREGNTGASGAVSDSSTGGDGVYQKIRAKELVKGVRRVLR